MKGIMMLGGTGSRLYPLTVSVNKHFLPVWNKPLFYYPLTTMITAGIREIMVICASYQDETKFQQHFHYGRALGIEFRYAFQFQPKGIADGLVMAGSAFTADGVCLMLGDTVFIGNMDEILKDPAQDMLGGFSDTAAVMTYQVSDDEAHDYGMLTTDAQGRPRDIYEKPEMIVSNAAIPGIYFYGSDVHEKASQLKPSLRNELEITDLNRMYIREGKLAAVKMDGSKVDWFDAGTFVRMAQADDAAWRYEQYSGRAVCGVPEVAAYRRGFISQDDFVRLIENHELKSKEYADLLRRELEVPVGHS